MQLRLFFGGQFPSTPLLCCPASSCPALLCLQKLMDIITQGRYNFSVGGAYSGSGERWVRRRTGILMLKQRSQ